MWEAQLKITSFLSSNHWMQAVVNWGQLRFSSAASNHRAQLHQLSSRSRFVLFASHCQFAVTKCPKMSGFSNVSKICAFHFILEQNFMQQQPFMLISLGHWQQQQKQGKKNPFASQKNAAAWSLYVLQSTSQQKLSWRDLKYLSQSQFTNMCGVKLWVETQFQPSGGLEVGSL